MLRLCHEVTKTVIEWVEKTIEVVIEVTKQVCEWVTRTVKQVVEVVHKVCGYLPWPLNHLCKAVTKLVEVLVDVTEWVCHTVVELVKTLKTILVKVIKTVTELVCTVIDVVISLVVGLIDFVIQFIDWLWHWIITLPEFALCHLGWHPQKHLKLCVVVLADQIEGAPVQDLEDVQAQLAEAARILAQCNVRLHACDPVVVRVDDELLDISCDARDWLLKRPAYERLGSGQKGLDCCTRWFSASLVPRPALTAIFVRDVVDARGCYHWPADFVVVDGSGGGRSLAHEIGHANDLGHRDAEKEPTNLMVTGGRGTDLTKAQCCTFRRGRYVTFLGV